MKMQRDEVRIWMFLNNVILAVGALIAGAATAAGVIALLTKLGVVPRFIARFELAQGTLVFESAIVVGCVVGCIVSIGKELWIGSLFFGGITPEQRPMGALIFLALAGVCSGIYVGCQAMALAEILNMFPILFRRLKLQMGLRWVVVAIAFGKLSGSLWYFAHSYQSIGG